MTSMNKTYTPELAPDVLQRLRDYAEQFQDLYRYPTQFSWSGVYLQGLLHDGERKSIEPLSARVTLPPDLNAKDPERGECNPPPLPPAGEEEKEGSGEGHKAQHTSGRFN